MGNTFRVINCDGDIEISIYKKANAIFKTNEYSKMEDICIYKETINIFNLLKENQELKKKYENAVADYETTMAEKNELKKKLEELELQNFNLRADIMIQKMSFPNKLIKDKTFYDLYDMPTYEELKKQVEELKSTNKVLSEELTKDKILKQDCLTTCCGIPIGDIPKLINQQKEFIEYLENEKDRLAVSASHTYEDSLGKTRFVNEDIFNEVDKILSKYKEIIGAYDENNT